MEIKTIKYETDYLRKKINIEIDGLKHEVEDIRDDERQIRIRGKGELLVDSYKILDNILFITQNVKRCKTCKWHDDFSWVCSNGLSDEVADFTDNDMSCKHWEIKDGRNKDSEPFGSDT